MYGHRHTVICISIFTLKAFGGSVLCPYCCTAAGGRSPTPVLTKLGVRAFGSPAYIFNKATIFGSLGWASCRISSEICGLVHIDRRWHRHASQHVYSISFYLADLTPAFIFMTTRVYAKRAQLLKPPRRLLSKTLGVSVQMAGFLTSGGEYNVSPFSSMETT